jgi:hypothetical protein
MEITFIILYALVLIGISLILPEPTKKPRSKWDEVKVDDD